MDDDRGARRPPACARGRPRLAHGDRRLPLAVDRQRGRRRRPGAPRRPHDRGDERGRARDRPGQCARACVSRSARPRERELGRCRRRGVLRRRRSSAEARVSAYDDARRAYDAKTKPRGSLGRIEDLGCRLAAIRGFVPDRLETAIVVAAGDHGVADEGVSAYPQEVTAQMVANFAAGGAAINVLARRAGARLVVVDAGTAVPFEHELVRSIRIGAGTANMTLGPAMRAEDVERAFAAADSLVGELEGVDVVGLGEMGISNTTSASALTAAFLEVDPALVCGRGTGLDDEGVGRKVDAVRRALAANEGADPRS